MSPATVSRVLHRAGLSRLRDLGPPEQVRGYGREYVHVCIDDHSRLSSSQIHADEKALSAIPPQGRRRLVQAARCESDLCHDR